MNNLPTIIKGRLGYNLVEYLLLQNGFDIYVPILENTKIDLIAVKNNNLYKIQIKTIQHGRSGEYKKLPVRKLSNNRGENKQKHYTVADIDYFIGADLDTNDLYIVPISFVVKFGSSISVRTLEANGFKNNIEILK